MNALFNLFQRKPINIIEKIVVTLKVRNMVKAYQGFHWIPKPYKYKDDYDIKMWNQNGTFTSQSCGEEYQEKYFK